MNRDIIRKNALTALRKYVRGTAHMSMGTGKTRLGLEHFGLVISKISSDYNRDPKGLIVIPKLKLIQSWKDEAIKWGLEHMIEHLEFVTYRSLTKKKQQDYDVIYLDECHNLTSSHDKWLTEYEGFLVGLTGTVPNNKRSIKKKLIDRHIPVRFTYSVDDAIGDSILNDYKIIVHLMSLDSNKTLKMTNKKTKKLWYTSEQDSYEYWTDALDNATYISEKQKVSIMRMKEMQRYKTKENYVKTLMKEHDSKCLIFANTKVQADRICPHAFYSGNENSEENLKLFQEGKIRELVCIEQLSEGANIKNLREIIIMHSYSNNTKSAQKIGRSLRLNPSETATCHILCYKNTVDEIWVENALKSFDQSKIEYYDTEVF